ncbi:MAG: periplasmic heavy metal sensor, partial [Cyanobacteria bacterium J003]
GPANRGIDWGAKVENLNLTPEQRQNLQAVRQRYQSQIEETRAQLRTTQDELRRLMASNASDEEIRAKHAQVQQLQQKLATLRFESMLATRKILTPEQRQALAERLQNRQGQRRLER